MGGVRYGQTDGVDDLFFLFTAARWTVDHKLWKALRKEVEIP